MKRTRQPEFRYKQLEAALVHVFDVAPHDLGAFRARMRHLRNLGVPRVDAPGSGKQIAYTRDHAVELVLALELEALGFAPNVAAERAVSFAKGTEITLMQLLDRAKAEKVECYLLSEFTGTRRGEPGRDRGLEVLKSWELVQQRVRDAARISIVHLSESIRRLDVELQNRD